MRTASCLFNLRSARKGSTLAGDFHKVRSVGEQMISSHAGSKGSNLHSLIVKSLAEAVQKGFPGIGVIIGDASVNTK